MMSVFPSSAPHVGVCQGQTVTTQRQRVTPCYPESERLPLGVPGHVHAARPLGDHLSGWLLGQGICARKVLCSVGLLGQRGSSPERLAGLGLHEGQATDGSLSLC